MGSARTITKRSLFRPLVSAKPIPPAVLTFAVLVVGFIPAAPLRGQPMVEPKPQPPGDDAPSPTAEDVDWAVSRAVRYLYAAQSRQGIWSDAGLPDPDGVTALASYALFEGRAPGPGLNRAMGRLLGDADERTILDRLFTLQLLVAAGNKQSRLQIQKVIRFLELQQSSGGGWSYEADADRAHGPISYLVLQSLNDAAAKGHRVSKKLWQEAERCWIDSQHDDGGWPLLPSASEDSAAQREPSTLGGTATGLAALNIIYKQQYLNAELAFNGRFKAKCGTDVVRTGAIRRAMTQAIAWLDECYAAGKGIKPSTWSRGGESAFTSSPYEVFALTRAVIPTGRTHLGSTDWYRDAIHAVTQAQQDNGSWGGVAGTSLALAGLTRGHAPLMFQKLQYGSESDWNLDPLDVAHLTDWCGERFEQPLSWRTVTLDADLAALRLSPILYLNGHDAPAFSTTERNRLRSYIEDGGTVLAVACCSKKEFANGAADLVASILPRLKNAPLPPDHPVWTMEDNVAQGDDCIGFSDGCRTSVFVLTSGACCAWHQNRTKEYTRLFALAGNIARYATFERPLQSRLSAGLPATQAPTTAILKVATLQHGGDWWAAPGALDKLSRILRTRQGIELQISHPTDAGGAAHNGVNVLWLTGHEFALSDTNERAALRSFVDAGGTIVASACCGRAAFDDTFRAFARETFGEDRWKRVPADDPLMTGAFAPQLAATLEDMDIRQRLNSNAPPRLDWPILFGVRDGDRWAVIYSPLDLPCGVVGHACRDCLGLEPRDARAAAANLMLYAAQQSLRAAVP